MTERAFQSYPYLDFLVRCFNEQQLVTETARAGSGADIAVSWHYYENPSGQPGSCLFVHGNHIHELDDPQVEIMRDNFLRWEQETRGRDRLGRCEGRVPDLALDADELVCISSDRGEVALFALWAREAGIPVKSLECPLATQAADLQKPEHGAHSRDMLFYYYVARHLPQGLRSLGLKQVTPRQYLWALECMEAYLLETIERHARAELARFRFLV